MAHIELPRALEDYFAFAETAPTRKGRRFTISLPYFNGAQLDRLQWWYHVSPEQERQMGEAAVATLRAQATKAFCRHIERWLENTRQRLHGEAPIPRISSLTAASLTAASLAATAPEPAPAPAPPPVIAEESAPVPLEWPADKVANG